MKIKVLNKYFGLFFVSAGLLGIGFAPAVLAEELPDMEKRRPSALPGLHSSPSSKDREDPVFVSADQMIQLQNKNLVKATGHVLVRYGGRTVRSRQMIVNTVTGQGEARGNVIMTAEGGTVLRAERAQFNLKSQKGRLFDVKGKIAGIYYVSGKEVRKVSDNHYQTKDVSLTTCTGDLPDWTIETSEADLIIEDRALFKGGIFKIKNIPILYIPLGYIPMLTQRKSGFLTPNLGVSSLDGVTIGNRYFWAINPQWDTTLGLEYIEKRGVRGALEIRYATSNTTRGQFNGIILDDNLTGNTFWKIDATHRQNLPLGFKLNAKIDRTSKDSFNKTFANQTENRTRRSSDSYASFFKTWSNQTFDILARYRDSEEGTTDDSLGLLPTVTYKTQPIAIGGTPFIFDQETSYSHFLVDLDSNPAVDNFETVQRADIHPQVSLPIDLGNGMRFIPRVGVRETYYSQGIQKNSVTGINTFHSGFSRELIDLNATLEGPKFNRIFSSGDPRTARFKHVIEPRIEYQYIPNMDRADRAKIKVIDAIDDLNYTNQINYFLTQRFFKKETNGDVVQIARFEISQGYDIIETTRLVTAMTPRRPFTNLRFDLDSQLTDYLMFNFDTEYNTYDGVLETINFDVGVKPTDWMMLIFEKRGVHRQSASMLGTVELDLPKGWNIKYSARFDEFQEEFLEHNAQLTFNNSCKCWGFILDFIRRKNFDNNIRTTETKFLFSIQLRGLGDFAGARGESFLHRTF